MLHLTYTNYNSYLKIYKYFQCGADAFQSNQSSKIASSQTERYLTIKKSFQRSEHFLHHHFRDSYRIIRLVVYKLEGGGGLFYGKLRFKVGTQNLINDALANKYITSY